MSFAQQISISDYKIVVNLAGFSLPTKSVDIQWIILAAVFTAMYDTSYNCELLEQIMRCAFEVADEAIRTELFNAYHNGENILDESRLYSKACKAACNWIRKFTEDTVCVSDVTGFALSRISRDIESIKYAAVVAAKNNTPHNRELWYDMMERDVSQVATQAIYELSCANHGGENTLDASRMYFKAYEAACNWIRKFTEDTVCVSDVNGLRDSFFSKPRTPEEKVEARMIATEACVEAFELYPLTIASFVPKPRVDTFIAEIRARVLEYVLLKVYAFSSWTSADMREGALDNAKTYMRKGALKIAREKLLKITQFLEENHLYIPTDSTVVMPKLESSCRVNRKSY